MLTQNLAEEYAAGYASLAAYMSDDIDGRVYRRFSYLRNRLLLQMQDKLNELEQELEDVDRDDEEKAQNGESEALFRLISRRYNEKTAGRPGSAVVRQGAPVANQPIPSTTGPRQQKNNATWRLEILKSIEETLEKYDDLLLREHEISSIQESTAKQRTSLANFIWNGKPCGPGKNKKPLAKQENKHLYRKDDSILLGTQEDAWLGTAVESMKRLMPPILRAVSSLTPSPRA